MAEAVEVGRRMQAKHIILTHFSGLYDRVPTLPDYLLEAGNVSVASDFLVARFNELPYLPKLLPLYKELYRKELAHLAERRLVGGDSRFILSTL